MESTVVRGGNRENAMSDYPTVIRLGHCKDCGIDYSGSINGRCLPCHNRREAYTNALIADMRLYWNCKTVNDVEAMRKAQQ